MHATEVFSPALVMYWKAQNKHSRYDAENDEDVHCT
jgi:hypothetical protein